MARNKVKTSRKLSGENTNIFLRALLTITIVVIGLAIMILLSIIVINIAGNGEKLETSKWVFNTIIPLVASWIGTVLAFHFGRENYESAAKQVIALTKETLDDISVENIMINVKTLFCKKSLPSEYGNVSLAELIKTFSEAEKDRVPILHPNGTVSYLIQRSYLVEYLFSNKKEEATLAEFLNDNPKKFSFEQEKGFVTVSRDTSVEEAYRKMNSIKECKDVFITDSGNEKGIVQGWLTDTLINRFLNVK